MESPAKSDKKEPDSGEKSKRILEEAAKTGLEPIESRFQDEKSSSSAVISSIKKNSSRSFKKLSEPAETNRTKKSDNATIELQRLAAEFLAAQSSIQGQDNLPESTSRPDLKHSDDDLEALTVRAAYEV